MTILPTRAANDGVLVEPKQDRPVSNKAVAAPSHIDGPLLLVCIDVEEEFDWDKPFTREGFGLDAVSEVPSAVHILNGLGVKPTLLVDYPVLADVKAASALVGLHEKGLAHFGTQLHAWVNPPFEEELSSYNSYAGNLPKELEAEKLRHLTRAFEAVFGEAPRIFRSGRYGFGPNTAETLASQGYEIDLSLFANRDFSSDGGPDYRGIGTSPFFTASHPDLFCIPSTSGYLGLLRRFGPELLRLSDSEIGKGLHLRGILERSGLSGWTWLSPEGVRLSSAKSLARSLKENGEAVFVVSFHSPSLVPGNTRYVRTEAQSEALYNWLREFIRFFKEELGGRPVTPFDVRDMWKS